MRTQPLSYCAPLESLVLSQRLADVFQATKDVDSGEGAEEDNSDAVVVDLPEVLNTCMYDQVYKLTDMHQI